MKGYLKSREGLFQLSAKCTSIGNEGCDLVIKDPSGGCVRADIEYVADGSCFILKDLNSVQGIYVNDCHIQNASVRLEPNDIIRFVYNGIHYEFLVECPPKLGVCAVRSSCLSVSKSDSTRSCGPSSQLKKPSARSCRTETSTMPSNSSVGSDAGWISGPRALDCPKEPSASHCSTKASESDQGELSQRVKCLSSEVERLRKFESECASKDDIIEQLHDEVTNLQTFIRQIEVGCCSECHSLIGNGNAKLLQLAEDADCKQVKSSDSACEQGESLSPNAIAAISKMRHELEKTKIDCDLSMGLVCQLERDMFNKDKTISCMAIELERTKNELVEREIEISVLEASLLRLSENKLVDSESNDVISDMSEFQFVDPQVRDLELACRSKDREIALFQRAYGGGERLCLRVRNNILERKHAQRGGLSNSAIQLGKKLKMSDCRKLELDAQVRTLTHDLAKMTTLCDAAKLAEKKMKGELDTVRFKSQDLERAERLARVDIEQLSKRLETIRSRVIQAAFAGSGVKSPDKLISDEELFVVLRKNADERVETSKKPQMVAESVSSMDRRSVEARKSKP